MYHVHFTPISLCKVHKQHKMRRLTKPSCWCFRTKMNDTHVCLCVSGLIRWQILKYLFNKSCPNIQKGNSMFRYQHINHQSIIDTKRYARKYMFVYRSPVISFILHIFYGVNKESVLKDFFPFSWDFFRCCQFVYKIHMRWT